MLVQLAEVVACGFSAPEMVYEFIASDVAVTDVVVERSCVVG
jgi:hypothetical protein